MSIQRITAKNSLLDKILDIGNTLIQVNERSRTKDSVYFRYKTRHTHITFNRYYECPPVKWSNWYNAQCFHWVNYTARYFRFDSPYIIEINDSPLSAGCVKNGSPEPIEVLKRIETAYQIYSHDNCKYIIMTCSGMHGLFNYYFGNDLDHKILYVPQPGCLAKPVNWEAKQKSVTNLVCLASDYETKGIDIVLAAWRSIQNHGNSILTIACPNVPTTEQDAIQGDHSIRLITQAPLTENQKNSILSLADISIGSHHIHGGGNITEGLEYGHLPLVFQYHSTVFNECGKVIRMPYWFYEPNGYGVDWRTFGEYKIKLHEDKRAGIFDSVIADLAKVIKNYLHNRGQCIDAARNAYGLAKTSLSYELRNHLLQELYKKAVE